MAVTATGSGSIDVASIVSQLMTIESRPLVKLQQQENQAQSRLSAFGRVQSGLDALKSSLDKLRTSSAFSAAQATISGDAATASVNGTAPLGRYAIAVTQLARAQSSASDALADSSAAVGAGSLTLKKPDGTVLGTVAFGGTGQPATLGELRGAINDLAIGVRASIVNDSQGARLVLTAKDTGAANAFSVELAGGAAELAALATPKQTAQDAVFNVNGIDLTSASNTVTGAIEGVTLNLIKAPPAGSAPGTTTNAEVIVGQDAASITGAVRDFVKAFNDLDKLHDELTRYDPNTRTRAILSGDSSMRSLQDSLRTLALGTRTAAAGELTRLADVGIEFQQDGTLKLDEAKFGQVLAADADKVTRLFTTTSSTAAEQGFAVRLGDVVKSFTDADGLIYSRQEGLRASIRALDARQIEMQSRLDRIQERLQREYSKLDALVSAREAQSTALTNALAGLPKLNGSNNN